MDPEDDKLVTLARAALARATGATEGAAVRDDIGRTYAGTSVSAGELELTAVEVAAVMALSSGVRRLESAVLVAADAEGRPRGREYGVLDALGSPRLIVVGSSE